jgi:hypothetical protein
MEQVLTCGTVPPHQLARHFAFASEMTVISGLSQSQSQSHITTDNQSTSRGVRCPSGTRDQFFFLLETLF